MSEYSFSLPDYAGRACDGLGLLGCYDISLPESPAPEVSIVVPIYNQLEYTLKCLKAIAANTRPGSYEVILVDDCSDLSVFRVLSEVKNLRVVRNFSNSGFIGSCNRGAALARGDFVLLLNNDTEVASGWLDAMLRVFATRPDAGLVGAKLVYPDGTLQEAGGIIWRDGSGWNFGRNEDPTLPAYNYVKEADYCSGACIMLRRSLWDRLGGFDIRYKPAYYEDTDIAFRVRECGLKVYLQPHAVVVHYEGKSNGVSLASGVKKYQVDNQVRFLDRWKSCLQSHYPNAECVFRARDRGYSRKTILIIDHHLPLFDQDAGSRNMFTYVKMFVRQGFSVKFLGDNFFPHQPYQHELEELGVEVLTGAHMRDNWEKWLEVNGQYIDFVLFSRAFTCDRWVAPIKKYTKAFLMFYGVDLISRTLKRAYRDFGREEDLKSALEWEAKEDFMINECSATFYPSEAEIEELRPRFPGKHLAALPLYVFEGTESPAWVPFGKRSGFLFVGSFAHPPNIDAVRFLLTEVMPKIRSMIGDVRLNIVGKNPPAELKALAGPSDVFHGFLDDGALHKLIASCRVSLAPLRIGGGIKGKILEAFFYGLPVVTTPIGIEGIPAASDDCVVKDPLLGYAEAAATLYADEAMLSGYRDRAYSMVLSKYAYANLVGIFNRAMEGALGEAK